MVPCLFGFSRHFFRRDRAWISVYASGKELANQVFSPDMLERADNVVLHFGFVPEEKLPLRLFFFPAAGGVDGLEGVGMESGVVDFGGKAHGGWREVLHLLEMEVQFARQHGQFCHVGFPAAGMAADEIGYELLV